MNAVLVDELILALASLVEEASHIDGLEVEFKSVREGLCTPEQRNVIDTFFRDILSQGRNVQDVMLRSHENSSEDWYEFIPKKGEISIIAQTDKRVHTLTIRQQSVHAQGE